MREQKEGFLSKINYSRPQVRMNYGKQSDIYVSSDNINPTRKLYFSILFLSLVPLLQKVENSDQNEFQNLFSCGFMLPLLVL